MIPLFLASILALVPWASALTYHGADFSSLVNLEQSGLVYKDASSASGAKFETILHNHGTNLARIRVWTSTSNSDYSLTYGLALAKRAQAAGMNIMVDLHYSDTCKHMSQSIFSPIGSVVN
jgi:arabinogalactan endo-1,4-beta-galactosidase